MAFGRGGSKRFKKGGNDKYLRLTGLWQSKGNEDLMTGRVKPEDVEALLKRCEDAIEAEAPLVFSLWNNTKKESPRDPECTLQCFVGEAEEYPKKSYGSKKRREEPEEEEEEEEKPRRKKAAEEEEEEEAPRKPGKKSTKKASDDW